MLGKYNRRTVRASSGAVAPGATVSFFWQSNGTPAMVYADQDGNNPLGSSVQSDDDGRIAVFITPGLYRIVVTLDGAVIEELTHEPIVGQLAYADPDSYALRSELKLHDEDIQLVAKSVTEMKLAGGPRMASGRVLPADEIGMLADTGAMFKTAEYHDGTSVGGAEYQLRTRASYRTEIGDATWEPDGRVDHYLLNGSTFVAVLANRDVIDVDCCGARGDGISDDTQAFVSAVSSALSGVTFTREYGIYDQILVNRNFFHVSGKGSARLINYFEEARGTTKALFYSEGLSIPVTTLSGNFEPGAIVATMVDASSLNVGDIISFTSDFPNRNISVILGISGNAVTLDRSASNACLSGQDVSLLTPIRNLTIGGFHVDFNGSDSAPRYGYGVNARLTYNLLVKSITANDVASKVVQVSASLDGHIQHIKVTRGVDNFGTGGHGYGVRLSTCNDISVSWVSGEKTRHVVDLTGSSRNLVKNCRGYASDSACFLTHGNNCKDNLFKDNTSIYSLSPGAYSLNPVNGDTGNIIDGGYVESGMVLYHWQDGSNIVKNVICVAHKWQSVSCGIEAGDYKQTYENCTFTSDSGYNLLSSGDSTTSRVVFKGCKFIIGNKSISALAALDSQSTPLNLIFDGCLIDIRDTASGIIQSSSACKLSFTSCTVTAGTQTSLLPLLVVGSCESCYCVGSELNAVSANHWFSANGPMTLAIHNCRFTNTSAFFRRYTSGDSNIVYGENYLVNSTIGSLSNLGVLSTIGTPDLKLTSAPAGNWANESRIMNSNPAAAASSPSYWVRKGGAWFGAGHLSTTLT